MKLIWAGLLLAVSWNPFLHRETKEASKGLNAYQKGDYVEALTAFKKARDMAKDPSLHDFNLGVAAHRARNPNAALGHYLKAREALKDAPGIPDYNMGNLLYELEKPEEALAAFREALRADPGNEDARYNYEVLLRQMNSDSTESGNEDNQSDSQDQQDSQQQDQESQQNQEDGKQQQGNQNQQDPSQDQGQSEQQQSSPQNASQEPASENSDSPGQQAQPIPLDKQQAERLLNALTQGERDLLKARLKGERRKRAEKDW